MGTLLRADDIYYDRCPCEPQQQIVICVPRRCSTLRRVVPFRYGTMIVYEQYPSWFKMTDNHSVEAPQFSPSVAPQVPHKVYEQLSNEFLPAAKNVGVAGMQLLRAYQLLQESLSNYCDATHKLIKSADSADAQSQAEARELSKVFKDFVKGVNAHQKIVDSFETLALKVSDYSQKDKEKLKNEYHEFKKEEKKLQKQKHGEKEKEKSVFYQKSAHDWARQQELRYKFFNEKIHAWVKGYVDMGSQFQKSEVVPTPIIAGNVIVTPPVEEPTNWHEHLHEEAATEIHEEEQKEHEIEQEQSHVGILQQHVETSTKVRTITSSSDSSVATTLDDLPSRRMTNEVAGITLVSTQKRPSIEEFTTPPSLYSRTPLHSAAQTNYSNVEIRAPSPHYAPQYVARPPPPPPPVPAPRREEIIDDRSVHRNSYAPEYTVRDVVGPRPNGKRLPGAVPVFGLMGATNGNYVPRVPASDYQVVTSNQITVGRVVEDPITEEQMNAKKFHVEANYNAEAYPSHQPQKPKPVETESVMVQSFFNPSQYGSILIVNDDFNAASKEQMTVNRGDKVILLKCGSRGWVFVRDSVSNRTGWLPEPYVNL